MSIIVRGLLGAAMVTGGLADSGGNPAPIDFPDPHLARWAIATTGATTRGTGYPIIEGLGTNYCCSQGYGEFFTVDTAFVVEPLKASWAIAAVDPSGASWQIKET